MTSIFKLKKDKGQEMNILEFNKRVEPVVTELLNVVFILKGKLEYIGVTKKIENGDEIFYKPKNLIETLSDHERKILKHTKSNLSRHNAKIEQLETDINNELTDKYFKELTLGLSNYLKLMIATTISIIDYVLDIDRKPKVFMFDLKIYLKVVTMLLYLLDAYKTTIVKHPDNMARLVEFYKKFIDKDYNY